MKLRKNIFLVLFFIFSLSFASKPNSNITNAILKKQVEQIVARLCNKFKMKNNLRINFFSEIPLQKICMIYDAEIKEISILDTFVDTYTLSHIYACLLHEFRHYMQDSQEMFTRRTGHTKIESFYPERVIYEANKRKNTLWFPHDFPSILSSEYNPKNKQERVYVANIKQLIKKYDYDYEKLFKPVELDADLFSMQQIQCPICCEINLYEAFDGYISQEGYACLKFRKEHYKEKQKNCYCKAHRFHQSKKLNTILERLIFLLEWSNIDSRQNQYHEEICELDKQCGSLLDRHSK